MDVTTAQKPATMKISKQPGVSPIYRNCCRPGAGTAQAILTVGGGEHHQSVQVQRAEQLSGPASVTLPLLLLSAPPVPGVVLW